MPCCAVAFKPSNSFNILHWVYPKKSHELKCSRHWAKRTGKTWESVQSKTVQSKTVMLWIWGKWATKNVHKGEKWERVKFWASSFILRVADLGHLVISGTTQVSEMGYKPWNLDYPVQCLNCQQTCVTAVQLGSLHEFCLHSYWTKEKCIKAIPLEVLK